MSVDKKEQVSARKFQWMKIEACLYRSNSMLSSKNKNNYSEKKIASRYYDFCDFCVFFLKRLSLAFLIDKKLEIWHT